MPPGPDDTLELVRERLSDTLTEGLRLADDPPTRVEDLYTLSVSEFRQVSYALGAVIALLNECSISVTSAVRVANTLAHANEAMKMLHDKNP